VSCFLFCLWMTSQTVAARPVINTANLTDHKRHAFESHETGWMGLDKKWVRRIYVGNTPEETQAWMMRMQDQYYKHTCESIEGQWSEGIGTETLLMVRVDTLGLLCQGTTPDICIKELQALVVDTTSSCPPPTLINQFEQSWFLPNQSGQCGVRFQGGSPTYTEKGVLFSTPPDSIVVYNLYAHSWKYTLTEFGHYELHSPLVQDDESKRVP
jgi:hypothetical protein